jgi:hypothetical protein
MTVNLNIFILLFQFILLNSYGQYGVSEGGGTSLTHLSEPEVLSGVVSLPPEAVKK